MNTKCEKKCAQCVRKQPVGTRVRLNLQHKYFKEYSALCRYFYKGTAILAYNGDTDEVDPGQGRAWFKPSCMDDDSLTHAIDCNAVKLYVEPHRWGDY